MPAASRVARLRDRESLEPRGEEGALERPMERPHGRDALNKCCIECVHVVSVVVMRVMRILLLRKGVLMNVCTILSGEA